MSQNAHICQYTYLVQDTWQCYIFGLASAIPTLKSLDTLTLLVSRRSLHIPNFNRISLQSTRFERSTVTAIGVSSEPDAGQLAGGAITQ